MEQPVQETPSVLVVDDNPLIVNVLKGLFNSEEYKVYTSSNGTEALNLLGKKNVDVIICDVMMPQMDGYELHRQVRETPDLAHIPFVFLTALGDGQEVSRGKESGADDYVVKPFEAQDLISIVKGKVCRSRNLRTMSEARYDNYRKKVIHTLSHEFRTPLVAINTGTELLLDNHSKLDVERAKNLLEAIRRGGQRLEKLVTDFMLLQQIEAGVANRLFETKRRAYQISAIVNDYLDAKGEWLKAEGFTVQVFDQSNGKEVEVFESQIHDILDRFIDNALKFRTDNHSLEIHLYTIEHELVVEVRDRGIGIDVERVREAIDVFGQIDREKLEQQGGGLGLAIANRYATINRGRIDFEKRKDGGSIVSLFLPIHVPQLT